MRYDVRRLFIYCFIIITCTYSMGCSSFNAMREIQTEYVKPNGETHTIISTHKSNVTVEDESNHTTITIVYNEVSTFTKVLTWVGGVVISVLTLF